MTLVATAQGWWHDLFIGDYNYTFLCTPVWPYPWMCGKKARAGRRADKCPTIALAESTRNRVLRRLVYVSHAIGSRKQLRVEACAAKAQPPVYVSLPPHPKRPIPRQGDQSRSPPTFFGPDEKLPLLPSAIMGLQHTVCNRISSLDSCLRARTAGDSSRTGIDAE